MMPAGAKRNRSHPDDPAFERTRAKIQTTQLVKRLENHALGTKDDQGNDVKLDNSQVTAIKVLIDKTIPSLQAVTLTGPDEGPIKLELLTDGELDDRIAQLEKESQET